MNPRARQSAWLFCFSESDFAGSSIQAFLCILRILDNPSSLGTVLPATLPTTFNVFNVISIQTPKRSTIYGKPPN